MPVGDIAKFTPDSARVGENLARSLRLVAKLLMDWSQAELARRTPREERDEPVYQAEEQLLVGETLERRHLPPLRAIAFDKLVMEFFRIWDELHKQGRVRYRSALLSQRGFHGPGRALNINRTEEELRELQRNGDLRRSRFAFMTEIAEKLKPSLGNARILFRLDGDSWEDTCSVHPELDASLWESWVTDTQADDEDSIFLTRQELRYVEILSSSLAALSQDQLRALGTHCSAGETRLDIEFNRRNWERRFRDVCTFLSTGRPEPEVPVYKMVTTAREVLRKSDTNKATYKTASRKVWKALQTCPELASAFSEVHTKADILWADECITDYRSGANDWVDLSLYCRAGLAARTSAVKLSTKEREEATQSHTRLQGRFPHLVWSVEQIRSQDGVEWATTSLKPLREVVFAAFPSYSEAEDLGVP